MAARIRSVLLAILVAAGLTSCKDALLPSPATPLPGLPVRSNSQVDSVLALPEDSLTVPTGCVEDQQETALDPATGEQTPCPLTGIVVVAPPPDPAPAPPPPPPPEGACDSSVDWDPDCQDSTAEPEIKVCPPSVKTLYWWEREPDRLYKHEGPASLVSSTSYVYHYSFLVHAWIDGRRHWVRGRGYLFPTDCETDGVKELRGAVIESMYWEGD